MAPPEIRDRLERPYDSDRSDRPLFRAADLPWAAWRLARKFAFYAPPIRAHLWIARMRGRFGPGSTGEREAIRGNIESTLGGCPEVRDVDDIVRRTREFAAVARLAGIMPRLRGFQDAGRWPVVGREHLDAALAGGRGAILVTAHFGYGLLLGHILRLHGIPAVQVMVEYVHRDEQERRAKWTVDGSRLRRWVYERTRVVAELMGPEDIVAAFDVRPIRQALLQNRSVLLAGDGRRAARFLQMPIFGRPYPLPTGFIEMAFSVGCPVLPVFTVEGNRRHMVQVEIAPALPLDPAATLEENLAEYARVLDAELRRAPHLWGLWSLQQLFESARDWSESDLSDRYSRDWRTTN